MKVNELREKLAKLTKDDISKLAVEFYKLIPKGKKEDYNIDEMIMNPGKKKEPAKNNDELPIFEMNTDIKNFIVDARNACYISPNRIVPKKERTTWRFKVKRWHKELIKTNRSDTDVELQAKLLKDLYELLCESCHYQYFTAYDTFESVGVAQSGFFADVIDLHHKASGKPNSLEMSIRLVVENSLNRYTLYSELMEIVISRHNLPDLKYKGIDICKALLKEHELKTKNQDKKKSGFFSFNEYYAKEKHNNLIEFILRFHLSLFENKAGMEYYNANYKDKNPEIKLYVLMRILFEHKLSNEIRDEIESKIQSGVKPRSALTELLKITKSGKPLPEYFPH